MFSGFEIEVGKSQNAFLIAHIVESCIIQSINQSWRGNFARRCLVHCNMQYMHAAYLKGNSKVYLAFSSSAEHLRYEIRFASGLSAGYKAKLKSRLQKTLPAVSLTSFVNPNSAQCNCWFAKRQKLVAVWIWIHELETQGADARARQGNHQMCAK